MKRHLLLFFLFSVLTGQLMAQVKVRGNQFHFRVGVEDAVTREPLVEGTMVELLSKDSVLIMAAAPVKHIYGGPKAYFTALKPPSRTGEYIVRVTHEGYETMTRRITLKDGEVQESTTFQMKREMKEKKLGTVVVRATKIKFYHKGDTLVYNADAFNLAEGSMLDALVEQLPGVELKRDGRILVNGKQVESLLLNGKDFFRGKSSIMLENLPSYMVKHVKVYEKQSEFSELTGIKDSHPALVMDVRLKREYSIGWTANAQVGGGTEDRWLGRLFALRFTPQSRLMAFANANNTNETRKPGNNGDWWPGDITGQTTVKTGGFNYLVEDKNGHFDVQGNVEASHTDGKSETHQTVENFMPGGSNTFARRWFTGKNENTSVSTYHRWRSRFLDEKGYPSSDLVINPSFSYSKYDNWSHNLSGEFRLDPSEYAGLRDSMGSPEIGARLAKLLVNRVRSEQLSHGYSIGGGGGVVFRGKQGYTIGGDVKASRQANESHDLYRLDYTTGVASDQRRRYYDRPANSLQVNGRIGYSWKITEDAVWMLFPDLSYSYSHYSQDNALYRLDELEDMADAPLGALPSTREALLSTLDEVNSYLQTQDNHTVTLSLAGRRDEDILDSVTYKRDEKLRFSWDPRLIIQRQQLAFEGQVHKRPQRTAVLPYLNLGFTRVTPGDKHEIGVNATFSQSLPSLFYGLGIRLDSDPLNVRDWNIDLSRTNEYSLDIKYYANSWLKPGQMLNARAQFSAYQNSVATGYTYDSQTGVRTYSPENVNGNWYASVSGTFATPLDKDRRLMLTFSPGNTTNHSVDLVALDGAARTSRSVVLTNTLHMPLKLDYSRDKWRVGFSFDSWWNHATSHRPGFVTVNGADMSAGLSAKAQLPWNMELATDFSYIWRYGYSDESMNTRDLVWNAQLSKSILKGNLTFTLIGFDILGQLSQVSYSLNAQGRTEQWRNVIPSYGMLRITYRLSKQPKQR